MDFSKTTKYKHLNSLPTYVIAQYIVKPYYENTKTPRNSFSNHITEVGCDFMYFDWLAVNYILTLKSLQHKSYNIYEVELNGWSKSIHKKMKQKLIETKNQIKDLKNQIKQLRKDFKNLGKVTNTGNSNKIDWNNLCSNNNTQLLDVGCKIMSKKIIKYDEKIIHYDRYNITPKKRYFVINIKKLNPLLTQPKYKEHFKINKKVSNNYYKLFDKMSYKRKLF